MPLPLLCCLMGLGFTFVVGIIGALLSRSINQIDKKLDSNCDAVATLAVDFQGYKKLTDYLSKEVSEVKNENRVLRESHHEIDKRIAVQMATHPKNPPL